METKSPVTKVGIEPLAWVQPVGHAPSYTNLTLACNTETSGSLYSHALLILIIKVQKSSGA